jgi:hypothetical protein
VIDPASALVAWQILWIGVGVAAIMLLAAFAILLFNRTSALFKSLQRFQKEVRPLAQDVTSGAARAAQVGERLQRRRP